MKFYKYFKVWICFQVNFKFYCKCLTESNLGKILRQSYSNRQNIFFNILFMTLSGVKSICHFFPKGLKRQAQYKGISQVPWSSQPSLPQGTETLSLKGRSICN